MSMEASLAPLGIHLFCWAVPSGISPPYWVFCLKLWGKIPFLLAEVPIETFLALLGPVGGIPEGSTCVLLHGSVLLWKNPNLIYYTFNSRLIFSMGVPNGASLALVGCQNRKVSEDTIVFVNLGAPNGYIPRPSGLISVRYPKMSHVWKWRGCP